MKLVQGRKELEVRKHTFHGRYGSTVLKEVSDWSLERSLFRYFRNKLREQLSSLLVQFAWSWIIVGTLRVGPLCLNFSTLQKNPATQVNALFRHGRLVWLIQSDVTAVSINSTLD
jgi:hypothetical protein